MKLSISNIGWAADNDSAVYELMKKCGFSGLEIAPTRIFPEQPYDKLYEAKSWAKQMKDEFVFTIPSMQSIWFGRQEKLFGSDEERKVLVDYTRKAIDFAEAVGCKNLVFGCPRNRNLPEGADASVSIDFFKELGDYAATHNTVVGMEANPSIYNTNYINDTKSALELVEQVDSVGFKLNLDVGTMIENGEPVEVLKGKEHLINHVHISEPGLKPIENRQLHRELAHLLRGSNYQGFVSIEVGKQDDINELEKMLQYVSSIFGDK